MSGAEGPRRYLIAVANTAEMRGTGGMILSYGVLEEQRATSSCPPSVRSTSCSSTGVDPVARGPRGRAGAMGRARTDAAVAQRQPDRRLRNLPPRLAAMYGPRPGGMRRRDPGRRPRARRHPGRGRSCHGRQRGRGEAPTPSTSPSTRRTPSSPTATSDRRCSATSPRRSSTGSSTASTTHCGPSAPRCIGRPSSATPSCGRTARGGLTYRLLRSRRRPPGARRRRRIAVHSEKFRATSSTTTSTPRSPSAGSARSAAPASSTSRSRSVNTAPPGQLEPTYVSGDPESGNRPPGVYFGVASLYVPNGTALVSSGGDPSSPPTLTAEAGRAVVAWDVELSGGQARTITLRLRMPQRPPGSYQLELVPQPRVRPTTYLVAVETDAGTVGFEGVLDEAVALTPRSDP